MENRIKDKILEIEENLSELNENLPDSFEEYCENSKTKAACERYAERIIEATVDLAFFFIKELGFSMPDSDEGSFRILAKNGFIPDDLAGKLSEAKGMRNILAHEYGKVDDEIVFNALKNELDRDVREFVGFVKKNAF